MQLAGIVANIEGDIMTEQLWLDYFRQVQSAIDNIRLLEFQENIRATSKVLGQTEIALTENPGSATLELSRKSLQKRLRTWIRQAHHEIDSTSSPRD